MKNNAKVLKARIRVSIMAVCAVIVAVLGMSGLFHGQETKKPAQAVSIPAQTVNVDVSRKASWILQEPITPPAYRAKSVSNTAADKELSQLDSLVGTSIGSGECFDLSALYIQDITGIDFHGDGTDGWNIGTTGIPRLVAKGWQVIRNPRSPDVQAGDVVDFYPDAEYKDGKTSNKTYGHTAVAYAPLSSSQFAVFSQGGGNSTSRDLYHPADHAISYILRPPQKAQ